MEITLNINGLDLHQKLSTYTMTKEVAYRKVVTTLDEVEHPYPGAVRDIVMFSLLPLTGQESEELYSALADLILTATYTNPYSGMDETKYVRVTSSLESAFALLSVDGRRRYKGGPIQLREL